MGDQDPKPIKQAAKKSLKKIYKSNENALKTQISKKEKTMKIMNMLQKLESIRRKGQLKKKVMKAWINKKDRTTN